MNKISVVIATLGSGLLNSTIKSLNNSSIIPDEILICIPHEYYKRVQNYNIKNVKIIKTNCKGQVAQRAQGFLASKHPLVLQLDDDIELKYDCLEQMVNYMSINTSALAVCPMLYEKDSRKYHLFLTPVKNKNFLQKIIFFIINGKKGYEPGKISISGLNMGLPEFPGTWKGIEWMPGACILHQKDNLINYNYYPFEGKAYAEDLFHSQLLIKKGVKLVRIGSAKCFVDFTSNEISFFELFSSYNSYLKAMKKFNIEINVKSYRLYIYVFIVVLGLIFKKSFSLIK